MKKNYSRREFIKQQALVSAVGLSALGCTSNDNKRTSSINANMPTIEGMKLAEIRQRYHTALFDEFIPNMDQYVIDHELGGFMCSVNIATRKLENTDKRAWF